MQKGKKDTMKFSSVIIKNRRVAGVGKDGVGSFTLQGSKDRKQVEFKKAYEASADQYYVQYQGEMSEQGTLLQGTWLVIMLSGKKNSATGMFELRRGEVASEETAADSSKLLEVMKKKPVDTEVEPKNKLPHIWSGHYVQKDEKHDMTFDTLDIKRSVIAGMGNDSVGHFSIEGFKKHKQVRFKKIYDESSEVYFTQYKGEIDNKSTITGNWQVIYKTGVVNSAVGTFEL